MISPAFTTFLHHREFYISGLKWNILKTIRKMNCNNFVASLIFHPVLSWGPDFNLCNTLVYDRIPAELKDWNRSLFKHQKGKIIEKDTSLFHTVIKKVHHVLFIGNVCIVIQVCSRSEEERIRMSGWDVPVGFGSSVPGGSNTKSEPHITGTVSHS